MAVESGAVVAPSEPVAPEAPLHLRYFALLRRNRNFRSLWSAQLISEIGDWFYSLAVYDLLLELTHRGQAVSWAIIIQTLPWFFMTPAAGPIVDHFRRRPLMILADLARGGVVLGLLLVRRPSEVWVVYLLLGLEVVFASLFEPARSALLPDLVSSEELLPANALSSATWSLALTFGAALGGMVTAFLGRPAAIVLNSLSFFASAGLIRQIQSEEAHVATSSVAPSSHRSGPSLGALREGSDYLRANPRILALILAKTGLGMLGGGLLLLAVFGKEVFAISGRGALAMGLLYSARGVGAGFGPILGERLTRGRRSRMWKGITISFLLASVSYLFFSQAPNLPLACFALFCGAVGGSNIWVTTTTLLQLHTDDRFRGRVFALDFGLLMLAIATSNYVIGVGLDRWGLSPRLLAMALGFAMLVPAILWVPAQWVWGKESEG